MTNSLHLLATRNYFYTHGVETLLIIAILFTLIGLLFGWALWRHCRVEADRVEKLNDELRKDHGILEKEQNKLTDLLRKISTKETTGQPTQVTSASS